MGLWSLGRGNPVFGLLACAWLSCTLSRNLKEYSPLVECPWYTGHVLAALGSKWGLVVFILRSIDMTESSSPPPFPMKGRFDRIMCSEKSAGIQTVFHPPQFFLAHDAFAFESFSLCVLCRDPGTAIVLDKTGSR